MDPIHPSEKSEQGPSPLVPTEYPPSGEASSSDRSKDQDQESTGWQLQIQDSGDSNAQSHIIVDIAPISKVTNLAHCQNQHFYAPANSQLDHIGSMPYIDCNAKPADMDAMLAQMQTYGIPCAVVYSSSLEGCALGPKQDWLKQMIPNLFTMVTSSSAIQLLQILRNPSPRVVTASITGSDSKIGQPQKDNNSALIALYVITSVVIVTLLIILTCAFIRVKRHPERYNGSNPNYANRARGLARAVLDSIPLVQVSKNPENADEEAQKNNTRGTENTIVPTSQQGSVMQGVQEKSVQDQNGTAAIGTATNQTLQNGITHETGPALAHGHPSERPSEASPNQANLNASHDGNRNERGKTQPFTLLLTDNEDICPICFDEYEDGDILRFLPCRHKFHAKCIDPWLLEASSECPLCRRDLGQSCRPPRPSHEGHHRLADCGYTFLYRAKQWKTRLHHHHHHHHNYRNQNQSSISDSRHEDHTDLSDVSTTHHA